MLSISFDQQSMKEIVAFAGFGTLLSEEVQAALKQAGDLITQAAVANTWEVFANPTGALASTLGVVVDSPFEIIVGSSSPYAARREYGFSGQTDSLGRYFANDPAKPYLQPALDDNQQAVLQLIDAAVEKALARMEAV